MRRVSSKWMVEEFNCLQFPLLPLRRRCEEYSFSFNSDHGPIFSLSFVRLEDTVSNCTTGRVLWSPCARFNPSYLDTRMQRLLCDPAQRSLFKRSRPRPPFAIPPPSSSSLSPIFIVRSLTTFASQDYARCLMAPSNRRMASITPHSWARRHP